MAEGFASGTYRFHGCLVIGIPDSAIVKRCWTQSGEPLKLKASWIGKGDKTVYGH